MAKTMTTMICAHCGAPFSVELAYVRARGRTYCSRECSAIGRTRSVSDRLDALSIYEPNSGCRLYLGHLDRDGYGAITVAGREIGAHRAAYVEAHGPIGDGLELDHLCRNRSCLNDRHLEPVPHRENVLRGTSPVALTLRERICRNGHSLTGDNVYVSSTGGLRCRACWRVNSARYSARQHVEARR